MGSKKNDFIRGFKSSIPIVIGYFSVSFTFGIMAAGYGLSPWIAGLISFTNLTSAGQFAGINLIFANAAIYEMVITQLIINSRYFLMSLSLTQKLSQNVGTLKRMAMSLVITDEIYAVSVTSKEPVTGMFMLGLGIGPYVSWTSGAVLGAIANNLLPPSIQSALSVALYGMFVAIVVPQARAKRNVLFVVLITIVLSCMMYYLPVLSSVSSGFAIVITTVLAALFGALFFPVNEEETMEEEA